MINKSTFTTSFCKNISMMGASSFLAIGAATAQPVLNVPFELSQDKLAAQGQGAVAVELPGAHMHSVTGVVGGAVAFDGIKNQQIQISNDLLFALQKEITI